MHALSLLSVIKPLTPNSTTGSKIPNLPSLNSPVNSATVMSSPLITGRKTFLPMAKHLSISEKVSISSGRFANSITLSADKNSGIEKRLLCRISSLFLLSSAEIAETLTLIIFLSAFFLFSIFL